MSLSQRHELTSKVCEVELCSAFFNIMVETHQGDSFVLNMVFNPDNKLIIPKILENCEKRQVPM